MWKAGSAQRIVAKQVKGLFLPVATLVPDPAPVPPPPPPRSGHDVFIAHSSSDKVIADALCATLEQGRHRCWIAPRDVLPGKPYGEAIIEAINGSRLIVVVLSAASNASPQVLREVERGVSKGIPIVPFRIEDVKPTKSMEYFLSAPHWLDALTKPLEAHLAKLTEVVGAVLSAGKGPPPVPGKRSAAPPPLPPRKSGVRRALAKVPRWAYALVGAPMLLLCLSSALLYLLWPRTQDREYEEYRAAADSGRGSIVFLHKAAPARYPEWRRRAEKGDAVSQLFVGRCYQEGVVVAEDEPAGLVWLEKSAAQGNDYAMVAIGLAHTNGLGVPVDRSAGLRWYTQAANRGNSLAMNNLAGLYADGIQGSPDHAQALTWYRKSATAGNAVAMRRIGNCYAFGQGVAKDAAEADRWYEKSAKAGDPYTRGMLLAKRLNRSFATAQDEKAAQSAKTSAVADLRAGLPDFHALDLTGVGAFFDGINFLQDADGGAESAAAQAVYDEMADRFVKLYQEAPRSLRENYLERFAVVTAPRIERWHKAEQHDKIVAFWEAGYKDLPLTALHGSGERDALIRQLSFTVPALLRSGQRPEAKALLEAVTAACDKILAERPWDWYAKDAYMGTCFRGAEVMAEVGEFDKVQPYLKRGWDVAMRQSGRDDLIGRYAVLPQKGEVPATAEDKDKEFFERYKKDAEKGKSGITKFTIPCNFSVTKYPFHVYVLSGTRGFAELQDQFRWLKEMRGGEIPDEVRASFLKLNRIAVENRVDFRELCVYALGKAEEKKE